MTYSEAEVTALLDLAHATSAATTHASWWEAVRRGLPRVVPSDILGHSQVRPSRPSVTLLDIAQVSPRAREAGGSQLTMHLGREYLADHPLLSQGPLPTGVPLRVTDVVSPQEWVMTQAYAAISSIVGARWHCALPIGAGADEATSCDISLMRGGSDFTDHEMALLRLAMPVLVQSHATAVKVLATGVTAYGLTQREQEVLSSMSDGQSATRIARTMGISERTVRKHQENIYRKLGVQDRLEAVVKIAGG